MKSDPDTIQTLPELDEHFFRDLCEHLGFVLIGIDHSLRVCFCNEQATRQFGSGQTCLIGRVVLDFFQESEREGAGGLFRAALERGESGEMEVRYTAEDGERKTYVLIVSPIANGGGRRTGASACMRDISYRKRISQELARSRRMASLGSMAEGVVHHFNNILGGMLTSIDYSLPSDSPRELRRTLRLLAQAIGRATRITQQLEAFAESEHQTPEWTDLDELVRRFVDKTKAQAERCGFRVESFISPVPGEQFEAQRLLPVLDSLTQNSFDAMSPGGTLTFTVSRSENEAVLTIADTGCGMSDEVMDRLFEPFFTTKGELAGGDFSNIGLGLAAVHGLVSEIGGTISVSSKVGEGTAVTLRLPLGRKPAE